MWVKASAALPAIALLLALVHHLTWPMKGANPAQPIGETTTADARCWNDEPQRHVARLGWVTDPRASVKISYNQRTKACVVEIALRVIRDGQVVMLSRSAGNTAGREYAHFIWKAVAHTGETAAIFCEVYLSSGEEMECHSESEFDGR